MKIPFLIMAGGRARRFDFCRLETKVREKALLKLGPKCFIEYILESARLSCNIDKIYATVSPFTPMTRIFLTKLPEPVEICETPGLGYHEDLKHAVKRLKLGVVLTVGTDIPLINSTHLDRIIDHYWICKKPAMAVMGLLPKFSRHGLSATIKFHSLEYEDGLVPLGINIIDGSLIDRPTIQQDIYVLDDEGLLFNINTVEDYNILISHHGGRRE